MNEEAGPKEAPPEGKKWWWRPAYFLSKSSIVKSECTFMWTCAFCCKRYESREGYQVPGFVCECGARFIDDDGMWGLVSVDYNIEERWA